MATTTATAPKQEQEQQQQVAYTGFWLYQRTRRWYEIDDIDWEGDRSGAASAVNDPGEGVVLRGIYSTVGLSAHADMMLWGVATDMQQLQDYAITFGKTALGRRLEMVESYVGIGGDSLYDKTHSPSFMKEDAPKQYLTVYPFIKTHEWYLLPYEERRKLMVEHGEMGREYPSILTNTVNSFGIQDQEFIVALEDDDPHTLVKMVQRLRAAEVRKYTAVDTPIYLGRRKSAGEVFEDLR